MASHDDGWTRKPRVGGEWTRVTADDTQWTSVSTGGDCADWDQINAGGDGLDFDGLLCWILDTGRWSDSCYWRDLSLWNDGVEPWAEVA